MSRAEGGAVLDGPTAEQQQRIDGSQGLYWRTCDQCAHQGICITYEGYYICEACQAFHERALDAAHEAIRATGLVPSLRDHGVDILAWAAVKAYTEFTDESETAQAATISPDESDALVPDPDARE